MRGKLSYPGHKLKKVVEASNSSSRIKMGNFLSESNPDADN
jgi:hypothetical protein